MAKSKATEGTLEYRQFILLPTGEEVRVRYNQDPALYEGTGVPLYSYTATEGKGDEKKEVIRYAVPFEQAIRAKRASVKESVASLQAQGLTAEEIVARLLNQ